MRHISWTALLAVASACATSNPGSPQKRLAGDAERLWSAAPAQAPAPAPTRRLTRQEYANTIRDLFGIDLAREPAGLPRDSSVTGFRNDASALAASDTRVAAYERLALRVAERVPWKGADAHAPSLGRLAVCTEPGLRCQEAFVRKLGLLLTRRPLTEREAAAYVALFQAADDADDDHRFESGARLVLRALLQSPAFLYRVEADAREPSAGQGTPAVGAPGPGLTAASRLAFFLWASAPDAQLLERAADLARPGPRAALVEWMLQDPRSRRGLAAFAEEWLGFYRLDDLPRDSWRLSGWTPTLNDDMKEQVRRFVVRVGLDEGADLMRLFTDTTVELTPSLAPLYEIPAWDQAPERPGLRPAALVTNARASGPDPFRIFDLAADRRRGGLLTLPAVLGAFGGIDHASIVDRGLFVLRALLCEDVANPGDNIIAQFKDVPGKLTDRQKFEIHSGAPACAGCHLDFDPLGLAFEPYDVLGRHRKKDRNGNVLRSDGELYLDGVSHTFADTRAFAALLASSPTVERCMVRKVVQYAYGREPTPADAPTLKFLHETFRASGRTYRGLVHAVAALPAFGGPSR